MRTFNLPDPGEGLVEAEIVSWRVAVGDTVAVNDILLEIETSKSLVELPSPWAGRVTQLLVSEGQVIPIGSPIVVIDDGEHPITGNVLDVDAPGPKSPETPAEDAEPQLLVGYGAKESVITPRPRRGATVAPIIPAAEVHETYTTEQPVSRPVDEPKPTARVDAEPSGDGLPDPGEPDSDFTVPRPILASPGARRLAREIGANLEGIRGTGPNGVITEDDVQRAADEGTARDRRVRLKGVRRQMFNSMTASRAVPQASAWVEADLSATMTLVDTLRARREFANLRVSPLMIVAKAACLALQKHPQLNSSWDATTDEVVLHGDVNLGIAAATPRGLVVPNIKRANTLTLHGLTTALNEMVVTAREGRVRPIDMTGGTFTITNVGVFGIDSGVPILNPGESAILCLGTITRRPWVVGTGADERIVPRWVTTLSVTFDHRLVDGEQGSRFLGDVATILADPALSLLF
ncbi:MAG: dihydrolipoamide acetyltransferase family protein [Propionibacteriaceae bacterium]|nr:2-oxo acid dehydrogenase subunit E2 [Micropruina sp.]HBX79913.1 branched-chain alpha-keto acid dehydrogenase subunit E2 [Propionibacteriaceae bacterium]